MGVILVAEASPDLLGGIALAAGRLMVPLPFAVPENHGDVDLRIFDCESRIIRCRLIRIVRRRVHSRVTALESFAQRFEVIIELPDPDRILNDGLPFTPLR